MPIDAEGLPKYAVEFEEYDPLYQREVYTRLGLTDQTAERLFRLLCKAAVTRRDPAVPLSSLLESALRWAAHPEHHRLQPRFPRAQSVLEERIRKFVLSVTASGLCDLEESGTVLRLYPLERVRELAQQTRLAAVTGALQEAYGDAIHDVYRGFPGVGSLDADAQRIPRRKLSWQEFNQGLISEQGGALYEISFPFTKELVVLTSALVLELKKAAVTRLLFHLRELVNRQTDDLSNAALNRTNYMLRDSFPSPDPAHQITLEKLAANATGDSIRFEGLFDVWSAVVRKLLDEADRVRDESPGMVSLRQSLALLFSWFSYARDMELKVKNGEQLLMDIYSQSAAFSRTFSFLEIRKRGLSRGYISKYGEEEYDALFNRFLKENDFKSPGSPSAESIVTLIPENGEPAFLHVGQMGDFLQRRLDSARDKKLGFVAQEYRLPWQALLRRDQYDERAATCFRSEEAFLLDLERSFGQRYPYLATLLEVCSNAPDLLIYVCERADIPLNRFFTVEGALKSVQDLVRVDRSRLMRQLSRSVSFWQRLTIRFLRFFHRSEGDGRSLWPLLLSGLHQDRGHKAEKPARSGAALPKPPVAAGQPSPRERWEHEKSRESAATGQTSGVLVGKRPGRKGNGRAVAKEEKPVEKKRGGGAAITKRNSKALIAAFSGGNEKAWFAARLGAPAEVKPDRAEQFTDRIIGERIDFTLDSVTVENLEEIAGHIASDPRLAGFSNREMLIKYVILSILERFK